MIHVAGTKGKGSTCAYIESFLLAHGARTGFPKRVGFYTSPHLIEYNERIRLDAAPLAKDKFAENFFEVWDRLGPHSCNNGPRALQLLALLSYHTFIKERVDVAMYETHHGGEYDVTNIVQEPVVTAVTTIGLDHLEELGPSVENIAWHKGGIFKKGAHAISAPQTPEVAQVLENRAAEKGNKLWIIEPAQDIVGVTIPAQKINAALAREASREFLRRQTPPHTLTTDDLRDGARNFSWPGRFQTIERDGVAWFLDGAHNPMSATETANWFDSCLSPSR